MYHRELSVSEALTLTTQVAGRATTAQKPPAAGAKIAVRDLSAYYGRSQAQYSVELDIPDKRITAFIGPSGCGKSTLLRTFNRIYDLSPHQHTTGSITMDGRDIQVPGQDLNTLRAKVGMVFQKPMPFPMSVYDNIAFGVRLYERLSRRAMDEPVEWALRKAALWEEGKDKLRYSGTQLSGGQQQRLCIARAIAVKPEVLLLDEPASALDPISTSKIEDLLDELRTDYTIVIVTHNMQQAARVSDYTGFLYLGRLVELGDTNKIFTSPDDKRTGDYITGRYG